MAKDTGSVKGRFDLVFTVKNIVLSYVLTVVLLLAAAWISTLMTLPRDVTSLAVSVITYLCIGICGFREAKHLGTNGLLAGAVCGLVYVAILFIIGCLANGEISFEAAAALTAGICILCGAIGGIIGVNSGRRR